MWEAFNTENKNVRAIRVSPTGVCKVRSVWYNYRKATSLSSLYVHGTPFITKNNLSQKLIQTDEE